MVATEWSPQSFIPLHLSAHFLMVHVYNLTFYFTGDCIFLSHCSLLHHYIALTVVIEGQKPLYTKSPAVVLNLLSAIPGKILIWYFTPPECSHGWMPTFTYFWLMTYGIYCKYEIPWPGKSLHLFLGRLMRCMVLSRQHVQTRNLFVVLFYPRRSYLVFGLYDKLICNSTIRLIYIGQISDSVLPPSGQIKLSNLCRKQTEPD